MSPCLLLFFFNDTATTEIYTLSLHDALPILRRAFRDVLPPEIRRRGKRGFEPPVGEWFRTELRDLFWDVIDTGGRFLPCVRRDAVETLYRQHTTRRADRSKELWAVFALHWWASRHRAGI